MILEKRRNFSIFGGRSDGILGEEEGNGEVF